MAEIEACSFYGKAVAQSRVRSFDGPYRGVCPSSLTAHVFRDILATFSHSSGMQERLDGRNRWERMDRPPRDSSLFILQGGEVHVIAAINEPPPGGSWLSAATIHQ
jgi:hypothetical protein